MSKVKSVSTYDGSEWGTPVPLGADDINIDITNATTNPSDSTNTVASLSNTDVTVASGDTNADAWTKFNRFRKRVANNFNQYIRGSIATAYNGTGSTTSTYSTSVINNYMSNVIGYIGTSAPSEGSVASQLGGKVSKSGDTMTGALVAEDSSFAARTSNLDLTNLSSASTSGTSGFVLRDVNDRIIGQIYASAGAGRHGMVFRIRNNTGGTSQPLNTFGMYVHTDNTKEVWFSDPDAWRTGLGAVNIAGDTMTGNLTLEGTTSTPRSVILLDNNITIGNPPSSSDAYGGAVRIRDKNSVEMGTLQSVYRTDGTSALQLAAKRTVSGSLKQNILQLRLTSSGVAEVYMNATNAWLSALGLANTTQFSPSSWHSKISANAGSCKKYGQIIMFNWNVKQTGAVAKSATLVTFSASTNLAWCYGLILKNNEVLGTCHSTSNTIITDIAIPWTSGTEYFNIILNTSLL